MVGSTGSIGTQSLEVLRRDPGRYRLVALAAGGSVDAVVAQALEFRPEVVAMGDETSAAAVAARLGRAVSVVVGREGLEIVGAAAQVVVNGVVGFAGLPVTMAALRAGRRLALANKESLIAAGPVVAQVRNTPGAAIIPVDSEHCAIHQCLRAGGAADRLRRLVLTASGGPFRGRTRADLAGVTVAEALAHPTWSMGPKITVDSSTLMNKGLEVIEAHELFGVDYAAIDVVVHRQSIVHSMVEFGDGSTVAQLSQPDMRLPIAYALSYPDRSTVAYGALDWATVGRLDFEAPDTESFPCLNLAYESGRVGGTAPAWLSAANEVAVEAFLSGALRWNSIGDVIAETLDGHHGESPDSIEAVMEADRCAREQARQVVERRKAA